MFLDNEFLDNAPKETPKFIDIQFDQTQTPRED